MLASCQLEANSRLGLTEESAVGRNAGERAAWPVGFTVLQHALDVLPRFLVPRYPIIIRHRLGSGIIGSQGKNEIPPKTVKQEPEMTHASLDIVARSMNVGHPV